MILLFYHALTNIVFTHNALKIGLTSMLSVLYVEIASWNLNFEKIFYLKKLINFHFIGL
jgi:hypothetical protein